MSTLTRRDWLVAAAVCAGSLVLRVPFRTQLAYHWDGAQFALALERFDMAAGQPQAPGFLLYVWLGRLANLFVGEPHTALVWLSVVAGAALPACGYLLGVLLAGRWCGAAMAIILATSSLCWFHSEIALTNIVDATLITAWAIASWRMVRDGPSWPRVIVASTLFAAVAGVRLQSVVMLGPLWLWVWWQVRGWRWRMLGLTLAAVAVVYVPVIFRTDYIELLMLKARYDATKTFWGGGWPAAWDSLRTIGWSVWIGLLLAVPLALLGLWRTCGVVRAFLLWWLVPSVIFGVVVYTTMPGYVLSYFPALALLAGIGLSQMRSKASTLIAVAVTNVIVFLGTTYGLTARSLREHDQALARCFTEIRARYPAEKTVIYHRGEHFFWGFRQFQYHLPEYRNVLLTPDASLPGVRARQVWIGYQRTTDFADRPPVADHVLVVNGKDESLHEQ